MADSCEYSEYTIDNVADQGKVPGLVQRSHRLYSNEHVPGEYIGTFHKHPFYYSVYMQDDQGPPHEILSSTQAVELGLREQFVEEGFQFECPVYLDENGKPMPVQGFESLYPKVPTESERQKQYDNGSSDADDTRPTKLAVSNLPSFIPTEQYKEFLEMFFEFKRKQDNMVVEGVELDEDNSVAIVEFRDPIDVELVLQKRPISMLGTVIDVDAYVSKPVCTIEVRGPPDVVVEHILELYFENTRKSGGDVVQKVDIIEETGDEHVAHVTFETQQVAQRVVEKRNHMINKTPISVEMFVQVKSKLGNESVKDDSDTPQDVRTVEVRGPPEVLSEEVLKLAFGKKEGGGDIIDIEVYEDIAYIIFKHETDAQRVAAKETHLVNEKEVSAEIYRPESNFDDEDIPRESSRTVKVSGIKRIHSQELVMFYFENKRRSGGGNIDNFTIDNGDDNIAYITFENVEVAERVVSRSHSVDRVDITVIMYHPHTCRQYYSDRVLIEGVKLSTTKDCLLNFLEAKAKSVPKNLLYGENGVILATFKTNIEFEMLNRKIKHMQLDDAELKVSRVAISNCVIVAGALPTTTKETVKVYFENHCISGGGPVENVIIQEDGTILTYFVYHEVIEGLLERQHELNGQRVDVNQYLEHLGRIQENEDELGLEMSDFIIFKYVDPSKIKYLLNSTTNREILQKQLADNEAKIIWPDDISQKVTVESTLTTNRKDYRKVGKGWKQKTEKMFDDFIDQIEVVHKGLMKDACGKVTDTLKKINITSTSETIAVFIGEENDLITVVGHKQDMVAALQNVNSIIKEAEDTAMKERTPVKETEAKLRPIETKMLKAANFSKEMEEKYYTLKVFVNENQNEIVYEGLFYDVEAAKVDMSQMIRSLCHCTVNISEKRASLYKNNEVIDYITTKLKQNNWCCVWEVKDQTLVIDSISEDCLKKCTEIIQRSLVDSIVRISNFTVLRTYCSVQALNDLKQKLLAKYPGKVNISRNQQVFDICTTDDIADGVRSCVTQLTRNIRF